MCRIEPEDRFTRFIDACHALIFWPCVVIMVIGFSMALFLGADGCEKREQFDCINVCCGDPDWAEKLSKLHCLANVDSVLVDSSVNPCNYWQ